MKYKEITLSVFLLGLGLTTQAQQVSNATGGDATGSGGTVAYSVGQVVYTTNTSISGTVSQGVQQPFEIFSIGINETGLNISLLVFPNPTADNLTLQVSDYNSEKLSYEVFDMQGKLLNNGQIETQQTQINTGNLASATYFIHVLNKEYKKVQSFKIIKN